MIYDCSLFFNELELLELRLKTLNKVVDYFVLAEADKTFVGNDKEFIFEKNKDKFHKYLDKIIYIKISDSPARRSVYNIEKFQRDCIGRGLNKAKKGDKIILSDLDEIPNPKKVLEHKNTLVPITFTQHLFYYYVNWLSDEKWFGSIMYPFDYGSPQQLRGLARNGLNVIEDGGWHYSSLGGAERVKYKSDNLSDRHLWNGDIHTEVVDVSDCGAPYIKQFIRRHPWCLA